MKKTDTTREMFVCLIMDMLPFNGTSIFLMMMINNMMQALCDKHKAHQACKKTSNN